MDYREIQSAEGVLVYLAWLASPEAMPFVRGYIDPPLAEDEFEIFTGHLREELAVLLARLRRGPPEIAPREVGDHSVLSWMDDALARYLESKGRHGARQASRVREFSERSWEEYVSTQDPKIALAVWREGEVSFLEVLLSTVWKDVYVPWAKHEANRKHPALSLPVFDAMREALFAKGRRIAGISDDRVVQVGHEVVARIRPGNGIPVPADIAESTGATRTVTAHRLVRWLIAEAYRREHDPVTHRDCRKLVIAGGFRGLARLLGFSGDKAATQIRQVLEFLRYAHVELPPGEIGRLLTWELRRPSPGRAAELRIELGDALLPAFVVGLPKGPGSRRDARRLIPIPERLPPMVGHRAWHSIQALLQLDVIRDLRLRVGEQREGERPWISSERWLELAEAVGLPGAARRLVVEAWIHGTETEPAFLKHDIAEDRLFLAPDYNRVEATLERAGRAERRGLAWAERSRLRRQRSLG